MARFVLYMTMNRKNLTLTLMLSLLLIGLAGVRLTTDASASGNTTDVGSAGNPAELVLTFEVRIQLPFAEKDLL